MNFVNFCCNQKKVSEKSTTIIDVNEEGEFSNWSKIDWRQMNINFNRNQRQRTWIAKQRSCLADRPGRKSHAANRRRKFIFLQFAWKWWINNIKNNKKKNGIFQRKKKLLFFPATEISQRNTIQSAYETRIEIGAQSQLLANPGSTVQIYYEITNLRNMPTFHMFQVVDEQRFLQSLSPVS